MSILIHPESISLTTVGGSASGNTQKLIGICYHLIIEPTTSSTTYDIKITNPAGIDIYERLSETGTLSETMTLPLKGVYTLVLSNATNNEAFELQLMIRE